MPKQEAGMCLGVIRAQKLTNLSEKKWQAGQADLTKSLLLSAILLAAIDSS